MASISLIILSLNCSRKDFYTVSPMKQDLLQITSPLSMELIRIPAGEFLMGSDPQKDEQADKNEEPQHRLHLPEYFIGKTPVTNQQYAVFTNASGHQPPSHWQSGSLPSNNAMNPVVNINWYESKKYCESYREGGYSDWRMPTINELKTLYDRTGYGYPSACSDGSLKLYINELIHLSCYFIWAFDTNNFQSSVFNFNSGLAVWSVQHASVNYRVLPVRDNK